MASDSRTRASDADRDRTAAALSEHLAAGRLTQEEFDERLDKAYAAKTLGELDDLMADLPGTDLGQFPDAPVRRSAGNPPLTGERSARLNPGWAGQVLPGVAGSLGILARDQPVLFGDLAGQRGQRRPVVLVGGPAAGRPDAGPLDHGRTCPQRTQVSPAAAGPQTPGSVTARGPAPAGTAKSASGRRLAYRPSRFRRARSSWNTELQPGAPG